MHFGAVAGEAGELPALREGEKGLRHLGRSGKREIADGLWSKRSREADDFFPNFTFGALRSLTLLCW